jgi:hypothetical protein
MWVRSHWQEDVVSGGFVRVDDAPQRFRWIRLDSFRGELSVRALERLSKTPGSEGGWWGDRERFFRVNNTVFRGGGGGVDPTPSDQLRGYYWPMGMKPLSAYQFGGSGYVRFAGGTWHTNDLTETSHGLYLRYWVLVAITALLPSVRFLRFFRHRLRADRRSFAGACVACGYDLRGSKDVGRCPECGAPAQVPTAALVPASRS